MSDSYIRDKQTGAVLNTNMNEMLVNKTRRETIRQSKDMLRRIEFLENDNIDLKKRLENLEKLFVSGS